MPGAAAFIVAQAKASAGALPTSSVAIGASVFALSNPTEDGGWRVAMKTENFETIFYGGLSAASFTLLGNGQQWQIAYRSKSFVRGDGETISFGANLGGLPQYEFLRDNLLIPNYGAGETYDLKLTGLTATGATVSAKINVPGASGSQSNGPTTTVQSSGPRYQLGVTASAKPVSVSGAYSVSGTVSGTVRVFGGVEDQQFTASGTVAVWARKAGVWVQVGTAPWSFSGQFSNPTESPVSVPVSASYSGEVQMGDGVESIGVTYGGGGGLSSAQVASLATSWTSQSTPSGVRSALAPGAKTTIRIIPQG